MHISKKGIRALGIAESYSGREQSVICAVAMRKDLRIDGVRFGKVTVGGMDATDSVISLVNGFERDDLNLVLISGCVISWFNVLNPGKIKEQTGLPVICVTYEDSDGLLGDISHHFPGDEKRLEIYRDLGERTPVLLKTGKTLYIRAWGIPTNDAAQVCNEFTYDGKVPEPIRVARLIARGIMRDMCSSK